MNVHPDLMMSLARDRQRNLMASAGKARLVAAFRRARRATKSG